MEIEVTQEDQKLVNLWPLNSFNEAYDNTKGFRKVIMTSLSSDHKNPDKTAILVFRLFIEKGASLEKGQKYVLCLRFYGFGDLATLDLISLNKSYHKNIASEHIKRMNWPEPEEDSDDFDTVLQSPFLFSGAFVELKDEKLIFSSTSQDYGNSVFLADCKEVSVYLSSLCGLLVSNKQSEDRGKNFLNKILHFILENKKQNDFYEKFVDLALSVPEIKSLSPQQISSLLNMKAFDRSVRENKGIFFVIAEELTDGFIRSVMLKTITKRLR